MLSGVLTFPIFFGRELLSKPLVIIFYVPDYAGAASLLVGFGLFWVVQPRMMPLKQELNGTNRLELDVWVGLVTLSTNVVLALVLDERFAVLGVVATTVIAGVFSTPVVPCWSNESVQRWSSSPPGHISLGVRCSSSRCSPVMSLLALLFVGVVTHSGALTAFEVADCERRERCTGCSSPVLTPD